MRTVVEGDFEWDAAKAATTDLMTACYRCA